MIKTVTMNNVFSRFLQKTISKRLLDNAMRFIWDRGQISFLTLEFIN